MTEEAKTRYIGPFLLGRTLGSGSNGKVKLGYHKRTGYKVAIKIIDKDTLEGNKGRKRKMEREIAILRLLDHPNVLRLYEVYETSKYLFLILEYVEGGELFDYLIEHGGLPLHQALHFFKQLIGGLEYCHHNHICHRDLKPENLLLSADRSTLKIADFGMAALQPSQKYLATSCGSPHYASPEVISGGKYDGKLSDVWSSGVILYTLVTGRLPFDDHNVRALLLKVKAGQYSIPKYVAPEVQDLIRRMLVVDPRERITLAEIRRHPWFTENDVTLPPPNLIFDAPEQLDSDYDSEDSEDVTPGSARGSISESEIDEEIVLTMTALGWPRHHVMKRLTNHTNNMEKAFYRVLQARRELPAEKYYEKGQQRRSRKFEENLTVSETARSQLLSESSEDRSHRHVTRTLVAEIDLDTTESGPTSRDRMPVLVRKRSQTSTGVPLTQTLTAANNSREQPQVNSAPSAARNSPRVRSQSAAKKSTGRKLYYHDPFIAPVESADEIADVKAVDTQADSPKKGNWWTSFVNTFKTKSVKPETARRSAELMTRVTASQAADVLIAYGGKITKLGKDVVRAKFGADKNSRVKCHLIFEKQADDSLPNKVIVVLKTQVVQSDAIDLICTNVCAELVR